MTNKITVAVSYFYQGDGWTDKETKIKFKKEEAGYPIQISLSNRLNGIKRSLRLNNLVLIDGELDIKGENTLEGIDPSELTNEQLLSLVGDGGAGNTAELELKIKDLEEKIVTLEASKTQAEADIKAKDIEITALKAEVVKLKADLKTANEAKDKALADLKTANTEKEALKTQVTKLTGEKTAETKSKVEMFKLHTFTEEELATAFFTVVIIKEIMTAKSIAFESGDAKAVLITKLKAGQAV